MGLTKKYVKPRKRPSRFRGNQWTKSAPARREAPRPAAEDVIPENFEVIQESASASKLVDYRMESDDEGSGNDFEDNDLDTGSSDDVQRRMVDLSCINELLPQAAICAECGEGSLSFREVKRSGLVPKVAIACESCGHEVSGSLGVKRGTGSRVHHDLNRRAVFALRCLGKGFSGMKTLFSVLGLPKPMARSTFYTHHKSMCVAIKSIAKQSMANAATKVLKVNDDADHPERIAVTVDGTWMKRGFSSLHGIVFILSWQTGQVLDFHVMSKHCSSCQHWRAKRRANPVSLEEFLAWKAAHQSDCTVNTASSAPGMETEGVRVLFGRSQRSNLLYISYIGDGDSKGYQAVVDDKPYGDIPIAKEECVGHVAKRLGRRLRELKKDRTPLSDGKSIGGRGRLTDDLCDRLQNYYAMAIKNGLKLPGEPFTNIARLIWASLAHTASTDDNPRHQFCPSDEDTYCGWWKWKAGKQDSYTHKNLIPEAVLKAIKPVYERLTDRPLLERCCRGATQNQNESLNGLVWKYCSKTTFCGVETVKAAVGIAVVRFNNGSKALQQVLSEMECLASPESAAGLEAEDTERLYHAKRKHSTKEKEARKRRKRVRKGLEEDAIDVEGPTYEAGAF